MKKAFASIVVVVFASLLGSSLLSLFNGSSIGKQMDSQQAHYPYYMSY